MLNHGIKVSNIGTNLNPRRPLDMNVACWMKHNEWRILDLELWSICWHSLDYHEKAFSSFHLPRQIINQEKRKMKVKYNMKHDSFSMKQEARKTFNIKFWAFRSLNYSFLVLCSHEERTYKNFDRLCDKFCNDNFDLRIIEEETRTLHERKIRNKNVECRMLLFELDSAPYTSDLRLN